MDENNNNPPKENDSQITVGVYGHPKDAAPNTPSAFDMPSENKTSATHTNTQYVNSTSPNYYGNTHSNTASEDTSIGFAIASLVLGIFSIITSCCCGIGIICSILGIIFGCLQPNDYYGKKPGMAIAGITTSSVGILINLLVIIYLILI